MSNGNIQMLSEPKLFKDLQEIDIDDLRANSKLNRFKPEQRPDEAAYLEEFWKFLKSLSNE